MPVEPEVVGVDYSRQLPANEGIYVGESATFLLVFYPEDFICNENDFTTTNEGVTVTMEEGGDNIIRISVADYVPGEETVSIYFREQLFMNVRTAAKSPTFTGGTFTFDDTSKITNDIKSSDGYLDDEDLESGEVYIGDVRLTAYGHAGWGVRPQKIGDNFLFYSSDTGRLTLESVNEDGSQLRPITDTIVVTKIVFNGVTYLR